jgi:hypothetical protein
MCHYPYVHICVGMKSVHFPKKKGSGWRMIIKSTKKIVLEFICFQTDQVDNDTTAFTLETPRTSVENTHEIVDKNL